MSIPPNFSRHAIQMVRAPLAACVLVFSCGSAVASSAQLERVYQRSLQDPEFKALDDGLQTAYLKALSALTEAEQRALRQAQRLWIKENASLVGEDPQMAAEKLKERFGRRRDELLQSTRKELLASVVEKQSVSVMEKVAPAVTEKLPAGAPSSETGSKMPGQRTLTKSQNAAENLERAYQSALNDSEFEAADSQLRNLYRKALGVLDAADAQNLRVAEKAWVKENGVLILPKPSEEIEVLKSRTLKRRDELAQMFKERKFIPAGAPVEGAPASSAPLALKLEEIFPVAPLQVEAKPETLPEPAVQELAPVRFAAWGVLVLWCVMSVIFHYRAFGTVGNAPENIFVRYPNSTKPYLFAIAGFGMALSSALLVEGLIWPLVGGVLFSGLGLLFLKAAAVDAAGIAFDSNAGILEIPNGVSRARLNVDFIRRLEYPISVGNGSWELQIHTAEESWLLSFSARRKWDEAYALLQKFGRISERRDPLVGSERG